MQTNQPNHPTEPLARALQHVDGAVAAETAKMEYIDIGPRGWVQTLPLFVALLDSGTPEGKRQARESLRRMARIADLGVLAVQRLERLDDKAFIESQLASDGLIGAEADDEPRQAELDLQADTAKPPAARHVTQLAALASRAAGRPVPLEVCYSARGFYLGTYVDRQPYSRESVEYWTTRERAESALANGRWTQRQEV